MTVALETRDGSSLPFADESERFTFDSYVKVAVEICIGVARDPERMEHLRARLAPLPIHSAQSPVPLQPRNRRRRSSEAHGGPVPLTELLDQTEARQLDRLSTIVSEPWLVYALATVEERRRLLQLLFSERLVFGKKLLLTCRPPFDRMMKTDTKQDGGRSDSERDSLHQTAA